MTRISNICKGLVLNDNLSAEQLSGSLLTANGMKLLQFVQGNGGIKLTNSGAFNRKCVEWAVQEFNWPGYTVEDLYVVNKVLNEDDFLPLLVMHELFRAAKLLRRYKGTAQLSKAGKSIISNHGALQVLLFETFFTRFDFTIIERFLMDNGYADYRHFLGVVDNRLDKWTPVEEFAGWCLPIYTNLGYSLRESMIFFVLSRVVRPFKWLGLIEEKRFGERYSPREETLIRRKPLFNLLIRFVEIPTSSGGLH